MRDAAQKFIPMAQQWLPAILHRMASATVPTCSSGGAILYACRGGAIHQHICQSWWRLTAKACRSINGSRPCSAAAETTLVLNHRKDSPCLQLMPCQPGCAGCHKLLTFVMAAASAMPASSHSGCADPAMRPFTCSSCISRISSNFLG